MLNKETLEEKLQKYIEDVMLYQNLGDNAPESLRYEIQYAPYAILFYNKPKSEETIEKIGDIIERLKSGEFADAKIATQMLIDAGLEFEEELER